MNLLRRMFRRDSGLSIFPILALVLAVYLVASCISGCATTTHDVHLNWVTSPDPAATCASLGTQASDGMCAVAGDGRCLLVTGRKGVEMDALGREFRGCLQ